MCVSSPIIYSFTLPNNSHILHPLLTLIAHFHRSLPSPACITMASESISPFFEAGAPSPSYPLLTCQTDLAFSSPVPAVTATEELTQLSTLPSHALSHAPCRTPKHVPSRSSSPYVVPMPKIKQRVVFAAKEDDSSSESSESSESSVLTDISDLSSDESDDQLIPKPQGQAGRPNRGGYNLEMALNWPPKTFERFQVSCQSCSSLEMD